jgi:transposase
MFSLSSGHKFLLCRHSVDMRKSFDGLCGEVLNNLGKDPGNGEVYIFINKTRNKIKLLHWEPGGFALYYKRLEEGTFEMPFFDDKSTEISWPKLMMIISGISIKKIHQRKRYDVNKNC